MPKHYERLKEPEGLPAWALLHRGRFNELALCQWPDEVCNAARVNGTGFCADHIGPYRERMLAPSADYVSSYREAEGMELDGAA